METAKYTFIRIARETSRREFDFATDRAYIVRLAGECQNDCIPQSVCGKFAMGYVEVADWFVAKMDRNRVSAGLPKAPRYIAAA